MPDVTECPRCGQQHADAKPCDCHGAMPPYALCSPCVALDLEPQGETVRLFTPAPAQMPGQMVMADGV